MRVIVTGGNSGIGKGIAATLASHGHQVTIACWTIAKAERAIEEMTGEVDVRYLDLADMSSIAAFANSTEAVDVLINNAAVFRIPLTRTADGFEAHMGTNHLGHFALTCLLGGKIKDRVVSVVSTNYMFGSLDLDDLNWHTRRYSSMAAYAESKLAIMLFINELARRGIRAYAANPGQAATDITRYSTGVVKWLVDRRPAALTWTSQSLPQAARSAVQAAATELPSGTYFAPTFKAVGTATGDHPTGEGPRSRTGRTTLEAVGRTCRVRLADRLTRRSSDAGHVDCSIPVAAAAP
jgi:NAD(P)-dependent dehydrogenase (short-subunit alcohol dehydrogenase family)